MLERKFCAPEGAQALRLGEGAVLEGYASLFGRRDQGGDVVVLGAYKSALAQLAARGGKVRMLWQHDPAQPIGVWDEVREDARGLWVKGRILTDVARGGDAARLVAAGAIDGLSIGYKTRRAAPDGAGRALLELDLWEVSLVTFPMQDEARVQPEAVKAQPSDWADWAGMLRAATQALREGEAP